MKYRKRAENARAVTGDKILTPAEIERLILKSPERTALIIRFLSVTGTRISEALGIQYERCKAKGDHIEITVLGKGRKERKVRVSGDLFDRIVATFLGSRFLFESKSLRPLDARNVAKEITRLGLKHLHRHVTPHMLRHSFAKKKIAETGKIQAVSEYLGHSSTAITLDLYVHETLTDEDLGIVAETAE